MYIKMVAPIRIKLRVTAKSFPPKTFATLSKAASKTGLSVSCLRNAYHSKKATMTRKDGKVLNLEWKNPIEVKLPEKITNFCFVCSALISFMDKITPFSMVKLNKFNEIEDYNIFDSIIEASRWSGVSVHALRNACEKGSPKVTRRKGGIQTYWIKWEDRCFRCNFISRKNISKEVYDRIVEKVGKEKLMKNYRKGVRMDTHRS